MSLIFAKNVVQVENIRTSPSTSSYLFSLLPQTWIYFIGICVTEQYKVRYNCEVEKKWVFFNEVLHPFIFSHPDIILAAAIAAITATSL